MGRNGAWRITCSSSGSIAPASANRNTESTQTSRVRCTQWARQASQEERLGGRCWWRWSSSNYHCEQSYFRWFNRTYSSTQDHDSAEERSARKYQGYEWSPNPRFVSFKERPVCTITWAIRREWICWERWWRRKRGVGWYHTFQFDCFLSNGLSSFQSLYLLYVVQLTNLWGIVWRT